MSPNPDPGSTALKRAILADRDPTHKRIGKLFLDLGLEPLATRKTMQGIGEIDLAFKLQRDGYLFSFLVEVSKKHSDQNQKIGHFFSRWGASSNLDPLLRELHVAGAKNFRVYVDMSRKSSDNTSNSLDHLLKDPELGNRVLFVDDIEYFESTVASVGLWARSDFLSFLRVPLSLTASRKEAIQFYLEDVPAFCFVCDVRTLLDSCYIARRLGHQMGYQRALDEHRLKNIGKEIEAKKVIAFPNSIIVNCEEPLMNPPAPRRDCPKAVQIQLPTSFCSCCVVDGQHRLLGFSQIDPADLAQRHLPVVAFQKLPHDQEVRLFTDINSKQKRIDSNLIQDLKADFHWNPTRNPREHTEKLIVLIARHLNSQGPLKERIFFGGAKETRKGKITLSTFVSVLQDNHMLGEKGHFWQANPHSSDISEPLSKVKEFFSTLLHSFADRQTALDFLLGNVGLRIAFRTVHILEKNRASGGVAVDLKSFINDLRRVLSLKLISDLQTLYGTGGKVEGSKRILDVLVDKFPMRYQGVTMDLRYLRDKRD